MLASVAVRPNVASMSNRYVVIMAGGRGERFWPESRLARPKQLLPIVGDTPMLAQTVERLGDLVPRGNVFVITNREQCAAVREACPGLDPARIVGEPVGRDTAAAVALATVLVRRADPDGVFAMLPADAVIHDTDGFRAVMEAAFAAAAAEPVLATVGIRPAHPATGYGYIRRGGVHGTHGGREVFAVERFVEKPDLETARGYLEDGGYLWNAGMFIWSSPAIASELERLTPGLWRAMHSIGDGLAAGRDLDELMDEVYPGLEKISIDYAVMEKASRVVVLESAFDWDDVGEWPALARHYPADAEGNVARGEVLFEESSGNIVVSREPGHLVALLGVEDLVVVRTVDATLVCRKDKAQAIKGLVKRLGDDPGWRRLT